MSATTTVEQLKLPGQAAAPPGPVDVAGMYVMHHGFRRDLDNFVNTVPRAGVGDRHRWQRLARRWRLSPSSCTSTTRARMPGLWPLLLARVDAAGDPAAGVTLEAMQAEHADIDPILTSCGQGFDRLAATADADARAALEVRLMAARRALDAHLAHEETDAMALVQRYLDEKDWKALERNHFAVAYSVRESLQVLPWVMHRLPEAAQEAVFGQPGAGVLRHPWQWILRPRFECAERRAFG